MTRTLRLYAPAIVLAVFAVLAAAGVAVGAVSALAALTVSVFLHVRAEGGHHERR
jgi:hypothetical protein